MSFFKVSYQSKKSKARLGTITTNHGKVATPAYIAVGTKATVKGLSPKELKDLGVKIFFVNTYHVFLQPGDSLIKKLGGLHAFCGWKGPLITDSGGFQVFSLGKEKYTSKDNSAQSFREGGKLTKISNQGVLFRSYWDGKEHFFSPEKSISIQHNLGADLIVAFDDCTPYPVTRAKAEISLARTHRWAQELLLAHQRLSRRARYPQYLYGVVQGSYFKDLREKSAEFISSLPFDGIAIGGVSVGEPKKKMRQAVSWVMPYLPDDKPRHLLGVGEPDDIFDFVEMGIDTMDCVLPTRFGRMGKAIVKGKGWFIDLLKAKYQKDASPIDPECGCEACQNFSKAYLHHLFKTHELLGYRLATLHNMYYIMDLMAKIREAIRNEGLKELRKEYGF